MFFSQDDFDVRFDWGLDGLLNVAGDCDAIIIVDVLSFSTSVDIALARGAKIFPARVNDGMDCAEANQAILASADRFDSGCFSLSPTSLLTISSDTRLVLPSPNGSTLCLEAAGRATIFCACLRNARVVARAAQSLGSKMAIIAAGERWPNGNLRPSLEDLWGAGAIAHYLKGTLSPEAQAAACSFESFSRAALHLLRHCASGRELLEKGFNQDVELAAAINDSVAVPVLKDGAFTQFQESLEMAS
jgi:2-phosphosulfolactate phosphatase